MARRIVLVSPHDPVALANRLKAAVAETLSYDSPRQVTGNGTEETMTLWVHRPRVRNDFKTIFNARMEPDGTGTGTRIEGRIGTPTSVTLLMGCWFGFVLLFLIAALPATFVAGGEAKFTLPFLGIPLAMLAFGILLVTLARRGGARDEAEILAFLARVADASET